jgi:hypothetical protein
MDGVKGFKIRVLAPNGAVVERNYKIPEKGPPVEFITNVVNLTVDELAKLTAPEKSEACTHWWKRIGDTQYCEDCGVEYDGVVHGG